MKKQLVAVLAALILVVGFAGTASARDMTGSFGIGMDSSMLSPGYGPGTRALGLTYYLHKLVGLQLLFNVDYDTVSGDDDISNSEMGWYVALRGIVPFALSEQANLSGVLGLNVGGESNTTKSGADKRETSYTTFWIDLGLRPEWFVSEHLSLHTQVGISVFFKTKDYVDMKHGSNPSKASGVALSVFSGAHLFGNAGVTFWF